MTSHLNIESRLQAPLVPLRASHEANRNASSSQRSVKPLPLRPASHPAHAPFGIDWHSRYGQWQCETLIFPAACPRSIGGSSKSTSTTSGERSTQSRSASQADSPSAGPSRLSKDQIQATLQGIIDNQRQARQPRSSEGTDPSTLWIAVNRYSPWATGDAKAHVERKDPVTLVFAHANGFSKETWEATLMHLIENWDPSLCGAIEDIFVLDMVNQGDSAILNEDALGNTFDWADNGRDILQFVLSYLPPSTRDSAAPSKRPPKHADQKSAKPFFYSQDDASLSHWSDSVTANVTGESAASSSTKACERLVGGYITEDSRLAVPDKQRSTERPSVRTFKPRQLPFIPLPPHLDDLLSLDASVHAICNSAPPVKATRWRGRRLLLVGHSVGAAGMIYTASTFPQLFESLVLVDPTIFPKETARWPATLALTTGAITRRDMWASREEAIAAFAKNKTFFGKWHPDVLRGYVDFGLRSADGASGVTLKVNKMQEAYVFLDTDNIGSKRAFYRMARLPTSLTVHVVRADVGQSTVPEESYPAFVEIVKHATHVRVSGSGHLIVQEKPRGLGQELAGYFASLQSPVERALAKL